MKIRSIPQKEDIEDSATKSLTADVNPPKLLVLPRHLSPAARICTLPHPRNSKPSRFLVCPQAGIHELKETLVPRSAKQSWLISPASASWDAAAEKEVAQQTNSRVEDADSNQKLGETKDVQGHVLKSSMLLVATPMDPVFLALPALLRETAPKDETSKGRFLSIDDIFEQSCAESKAFDWLLRQSNVRDRFEQRITAVCDIVSVGNDVMYRISVSKCLDVLLTKALNVSKASLPKSMEDKFVSRALEKPALSLRREESSTSELAVTVGDDLPGVRPESFDTKTTSTPLESNTSAESFETNLTTPDQTSPASEPPDMAQILRLRTSLFYILAAYVQPSFVSALKAKITSDESPVNFRLLDEELKQIAAMQVKAAASRSLSGLGSKRGLEEDEEAAEARAEKKRKKEEEEKRKKAGESHSLRALKKVDTSGMKKMSDFFGKNAASKKVK